MEKKYIKFYLKFHKAFQNKKSNSVLSHGGVSWSSDLNLHDSITLVILFIVSSNG